MKCPKCDTNNPSDSKYCKECATPLPPSEGVSETKTLETPVKKLTRGTTFAGRYEILEELGKGGMGEVFRVLDKKLNEEVAMKLIKPEIASDKKTIERFSNELKIARKIVHKNVGRMYHLSEEEETHYIIMEYVPGDNLKSFIRRAKRLDVGTAISIARQICEGLTEAHPLGVIHRDLKSSNIMIDKVGNARIMDFGIARSLETKGITGDKVMVGTPEYMSPEQAEAKGVDHRSDLYSLGVIIYEMVTGQLPFEGDTPLSIAMKHKGEVPQDPKELNPNIPEDLRQLILRCLHKEKEQRYQSAEQIKEELSSIEKGIPTKQLEITEKKPITEKEITLSFRLKKLLIPSFAIVIAAIIGVVIWHFIPQGEVVSISEGKPSIVVMYFTHKGEDEIIDFWREALAYLVFKDLSQSRYIRTIYPAWVNKMLEVLNLQDVKSLSPEDIQSIARRAKVNGILVGNYSMENNTFLIEIKLINARTGNIIASKKLEGKGEESVFSMVDDITSEIKRILQLSSEEIASDIDENISKITTSSIEAFKYYVESSEHDGHQGIQLLERAVKIDPEFAIAYSDLEMHYGDLGNNSMKKKYGQKVLELRDRMSEKDWLYFQVDLQDTTREKIEVYKKILEIYPDDNFANNNLGVRYRQIEEWDKAIKHFEICRQNFSHIGWLYTNFAAVYRAKGLYSNAQKVLDFYLTNFAEDDYVLHSKARNYLCQGKYDLSLAELERALSLVEREYYKLGYVSLKGDIYLCKGDFVKAEEIYHRLLEEYSRILGRKRLAALYLLQGKIEKSKETIQKGIRSEGLNLHSYMSYIHHQSRQFKEAIKELEKAWSATEDPYALSKILYYKGRAYIEINALAEAVEIANELKQLIEKKLHKKAIRYYDHLMGLIDIKNGNYSKGIEHLKQAISLFHFQIGYIDMDEHALLFNPLAYAYYKVRDLDNALIQYKKISNLTMGRIYFGDIYAKSFYMIGKIYKQKGEKAKAIENYEKFLDLWKDADPGIAEVEDARKRLAGLQELP